MVRECENREPDRRASAPEEMVEDVIGALRALGPVDVTTMAGREEKVEFKLPAKLTQAVAREV